MPRKTTPTYVLLNQITLAANSSSVTFSNIPQGYGDLVLVTNSKVTSGEIEMNLIFNGASANLPWVRMLGYSGGIISDKNSTPYPMVGIVGLGTQSVQIFDYSASNKHKTFLIRQAFGSIGWTAATAGRYENNSPITSITLDPFSFDLAQGFTVSLYGLVA